MVVEILVNVNNTEHTDALITERFCWRKGHMLVAKEQGWNWGLLEVPPYFCKVTITDAPDLESVLSYVTPWMRKTTYDILEHEPTQDFFRVKIKSTTQSIGDNTTGLLKLKEMETFLIKWGADQLEESVDGIIFEITAMDALNATGYLDYGDDDENVIYNELEYNIAEGIHVINCDYSATNITAEKMELSLIEKKCTIVSHNTDTRIICFNASRYNMISYLESQVRVNFDNMIGRSQYSLPDSIVDQYNVSLTYDEFLSNIIDIRTV